MKRVGIGAAVVVALAALVAAVSLWSPDRPALVAPKRAAAVGISPGAGIRDLSDDELAADLDRMVELGVTWIRFDIDWSVIEDYRGQLEWESTDRVVRAAADRGLQVLGLLAYTPDWARPGDATDKHPPIELADFVRFATAAVDHYGGLIAAWEIWNEPNVAAFWEPSPDPAGYGELLRASAEAIRAVDPDAVVISGGLAPAEDGSSELSPETFLRRLYDTLPAGVVDGVAIHPYSFPALPSDDRFGWNLFSRLPEIRDLVDEAEGEPTPLWLTEFGAPFDPDEATRQADIVAEGVLCANQWPWAGPLFIYALRDLADPSTDRQFGLLTTNNSSRPTWQRVKDAVAAPTGETVASPCGDGDGTSPQGVG